LIPPAGQKFTSIYLIWLNQAPFLQQYFTMETVSQMIYIHKVIIISILSYQCSIIQQIFWYTDVHQHIVSIDISEGDTYNELISLDPNKATGIDCIGPQLLKNCALLLSLHKRTLPLEWYTHCIVPVYKSGDRGLVSIYCPISLLCSTQNNRSSQYVYFIIQIWVPWSVTQQMLTVFNNIIYTPDIIYLDFL